MCARPPAVCRRNGCRSAARSRLRSSRRWPPLPLTDPWRHAPHALAAPQRLGAAHGVAAPGGGDACGEAEWRRRVVVADRDRQAVLGEPVGLVYDEPSDSDVDREAGAASAKTSPAPTSMPVPSASPPSCRMPTSLGVSAMRRSSGCATLPAPCAAGSPPRRSSRPPGPSTAFVCVPTHRASP